jgi:hypothetical protein
MSGLRGRSEDPCRYPRARRSPCDFWRFYFAECLRRWRLPGQAPAPQPTVASTPQGPLETVQGKVLQEPGDQPIRKASVELSSDEQESGEKYSAVTDE